MCEKMLLLSGYGAPGCADMVVCRLFPNGTLKTEFMMEHGRAPSFCCQANNGWIYAASERSNGADITAYALENGILRETAFLEIPEGRGLCHLYAFGNVIYGSCFENGLFFAADCNLTRVLWTFQPERGHAHWSQAVDGKIFFVDLGNDCLYRFSLLDDLPTGTCEILPQPHGSGPRQAIVSANDEVDCIYELDGHIRVLNGDGQTLFEAKASGAAATNYPGGSCANEDRILFVSNRGPNTISVWQRDGMKRRMLCECPTGDWPRMLTAVPGTPFLLAACQREGAVHCYSCANIPGSLSETFSLPLSGASCALTLRCV